MILMQKSRQADYRAAFSREIRYRVLYSLFDLFQTNKKKKVGKNDKLLLFL